MEKWHRNLRVRCPTSKGGGYWLLVWNHKSSIEYIFEKCSFRKAIYIKFSLKKMSYSLIICRTINSCQKAFIFTFIFFFTTSDTCISLCKYKFLVLLPKERLLKFLIAQVCWQWISLSFSEKDCIFIFKMYFYWKYN